MTTSPSGDYKLPTAFDCFLGNCVLRVAPLMPAAILSRLVSGHSNYQVSSENEVTGYQGVSDKKLDSMKLPARMSGKSVLDLGCAEGFFARECAKRGAAPVVGVDSSLGRLLYGTSMAQQGGLHVRFRMDVFPSTGITGTYDYVLCLSLLHHSLSQKNVWKVLTFPEFAQDAAALRSQLKLLRSLTAPNGTCIVEMPYEYSDPAAERASVNFDAFSSELKAAGFKNASRLGSWDYNPSHREFKDRILYLAEA
jgi:SAM-dependent methyltransferase